MVEAIRRSSAGREAYGRLAGDELCRRQVLTSNKNMNTRPSFLIDEDSCGRPMDKGWIRDEPAEEIRGSKIIKEWLLACAKLSRVRAQELRARERCWIEAARGWVMRSTARREGQPREQVGERAAPKVENNEVKKQNVGAE